MWLYLGLFSALFLGLYDVSRKHSLQKNSVLPVLLYACISASILTVIAVVLSEIFPEFMGRVNLYIPHATAKQHVLLFIKSAIVFSAWVLSYAALKRLPISIATPIAASGPVWTLLGAMMLFHEYPKFMQLIGIIVMIASYYFYSLIGNKEGIYFSKNKWVWFIVLATLIGACSGLYDKYLIGTLKMSPLLVQAWFFIYLVAMLVPALFLSKILKPEDYKPLVWRWSVPLIGLFLIVADFAYFRALTYPGSMVSILSSLRAGYILVSFAGGIVIFKELQAGYKAIAVTGVLAGVYLIMIAG